MGIALILDKTLLLLDLKKDYDLFIKLSIVIEVYNNQSPSIYFDTPLISFIHSIGAEIDIDLYNF